MIATPFRLSFDYQSVCDAVEGRTYAARAEAQERGLRQRSRGRRRRPLLRRPAPGAHRDAAAERRHGLDLGPALRRRSDDNNKRAAEAIPLFESVVAPIAVEAVAHESLPTTPFARAST